MLLLLKPPTTLSLMYNFENVQKENQSEEENHDLRNFVGMLTCSMCLI